MNVRLIALLMPLLLAGSCARKGPEREPSPFGATGIPPSLRGRNSGEAPVVTGGQATPEQIEALKLTPDEDIVWTDPDNPDAGLPELSTLLSQTKTRGPWTESEGIARKRASREGKPLLIWFTDSARSPMCKALSQELFSTNDFNNWATEHIVRLRVDSNVRGNSILDNPEMSLDEEATKETDIRNYVKRLKKRYKVLGQPTMVMLSPGGKVLSRFSGYKRGQADYTWGLIKQAEVASSASYEKELKRLKGKGYRQWEDKRGRRVLAKLTNYSKGTLTMVEPDGTRCKTHERKLSKKDREWLDEQKRLRGLD